MIPYLGGTCPGTLSGMYVPSDYFPTEDTFNSPGPSSYDSGGIGSTACTSLNVNCGSYSFGTAFGLPVSPSTLDGTWTLYIANQAGSPYSGPSGSLGSWSITFTTAAAAATTTTISVNNNGLTSTVFTNGNVGGQSETGTAVTFTATVLSNVSPVAGGTVTFYDSTFSSPGIVLASAVPVNSSGQAQAIVTFPPSEEGSRGITAAYSGVSGTYASSRSSSVSVLTVNHPYNPSGSTFCNGPVYINDNLGAAGGTGGFPYASQLVLGSSFSQLQGTIESVTVSLNGLQSEQPNSNGFLLQAPSGQAFEFMSWADGSGPGGDPAGLTNLNLTLSDTGSGLLQTSTDNQENCSSTPCKPADDYSQISPLYNDTFPSPAPSTIGKPYPTGSATFTSEFGGGAANGTWLLYLNNWFAEDPSSNSSLPYGEIGSWCLNFTMQANAHPTTASVSGSPNPASFTPPATTASVGLTANVSVTDGSGLTVDAGTVTFFDGATTLGSSPVTNGEATLNASLAEGTHQIVASYSGTNTGTEFGISTGTFDQRVDTATTNPSSGSGAGPYTYCNTGAITAPGLGLDSGAAAPYPSNIFVTNLPGTVNAVTVSLNGFSTKDQGDLLSLLVGPGGNNLDFFSLTGSNVSNAPSPINLTFSDLAGSNIPRGSSGNLSSSGTFKPTSYNTSIAYPQCPPNAGDCASPPVGPPLASNPFTPTYKTAPAGTSALDEVFGGGSSSTYNGNGTWSLYLDDGGPTGGGELTNITGGWCVSLTENLPEVAVTKSHSGTVTQGQQNVPFTIGITNNGTGPSGDPTGGKNPLTVVDILNSAYAYAGFSGTGWNCSASGQTVTCTNDSAVAQGGSYAELTIDVNVSSTASTTMSISNSVSVSGGGVQHATSNTDNVTVLPAPVLAVQKSHMGSFVQSQTAQWSITVSNTASSGSTYGTITVSDSLPSNYTMASYTSTASAWNCSGANAVSCSTTSGISGGAPSVITLTVNVPANSPVSVTNTAAAWGGGDLTHASSGTAVTASDTAAVVQSPASISINGMGTQSAPVNTAFGGLAVTVKDAGGVFIPNYSGVTFTATVGGSGQSGTFSNSTGTTTVNTNSSGVADPGTFTANGVAGSYTVGVTAGSATTTFNLTNSQVSVEVPTANVCPIGQNTPAPCTYPITVPYDNSNGATFGPVKVVTEGAANLGFTLASTTCTGTAASCTVNVTFAPHTPGVRMGAVEIYDNNGNLLARNFIYGIGVGPAIAFGPGTQTTLPVSVGMPPLALKKPGGVAVDSSGDVFIADYGNSRVVKIPEGCTTGSCQSTVGSGFSGPLGVAVDGAGDVLVADSGHNQVVEIPAGCTSSMCQTTVGYDLSFPTGLTVDGTGDIFIADTNNNRVVEVPAGCTSSSCQSTVGSGLDDNGGTYPYGVAVDAAGDVFIALSLGPPSGDGRVLEVPAGCSSSSCQVTVGSGFRNPNGVAVDAAGDVFFANYNGGVVEIPAGCGVSSCQENVGSGLKSPSDVFADAAGNVVIADYGNNRVVKVDRQSPPFLSFAATNVGSDSSPLSITIQNIGNQALNAIAPGLVIGANFAQVAGSGTPADCTSSFSLVAGAMCNLSVSFEPQSPGVLKSTAVFTDNSKNASPSATQTIPLKGSGVVIDLTYSPQSLSFGNVVVDHKKSGVVTLTNAGYPPVDIGPITLSVTQGDSSQFMLGHVCPAKLLAGKSCTIAVDFTPDGTGADAATLSITTNDSNSPIQIQITAAGVN
jgi:hypothetical protein